MTPHSAEAIPNDELPLNMSYRLEAKKEVISYNLHAPFEILNKYGSQMKRLRDGNKPIQLNLFETRLNSETEINSSSSQVLSAANILRMAKMELLQKKGDFSNLLNSSEFDSGFDYNQEKLLKLALCLLNAAEKFSHKDYDEAEKLLNSVLLASYDDAHPIERVVTCFARNLRERIDSETGKFDLEREVVHVDIDEALVDLRAAIHTCEQKLPFNQIAHFTGIQTILDSVGSAKRIHFIDIGKKVGSHWIVMMHALANRKNCPLEQLKITAVCTPKDNIEETEMYELEKDMLELEANEAMAVYMEFSLMSLSICHKHNEALLKGIKSLNPHLMVVREIEANINGSDFFIRFHEALFLCSAMFDCYEDCLERDNQCRKILEKVYFQEIIKYGVMAYDDEDFKKCRKIDFWREYFARFGIVEIELSQSSMHQASLLIRDTPCWRSCTLEKLFRKCAVFSSPADNNPLQRVVKIFVESLRERINLERGKIDFERKTIDLKECVMKFHSTVLDCERKLPSLQITEFTAIQIILDTVASSRTIHSIDFGIHSVSTATVEDEERIRRHAKIGFWRKLFSEFDIVETKLSESSLDQARLMVKRCALWDSCTIHMDVECMVVGWKGTPLQSLST
ncbi:hypothetical protein BUALT_Bualt14G0124800 [Buddleja alternifolia]|uniref:Uncharacterized protein n=1 Tax=Buddleja alternifolia TaxID=168488 RepID=A0AAV6WIE2_9LAMI|nr:hypothetical protein BUALT_Bualt14G0124800 [Buddleja alternifolia]